MPMVSPRKKVEVVHRIRTGRQNVYVLGTWEDRSLAGNGSYVVETFFLEQLFGASAADLETRFVVRWKNSFTPRRSYLNQGEMYWSYWKTWMRFWTGSRVHCGVLILNILKYAKSFMKISKNW